MKVLANENLPRDAVEALRRDGHDVLWARTDMPGVPDPQIMARARAEGRVLLTFDKDFGELAFRSGLVAPCGIILFRLGSRSPSEAASAVLTVVRAREDWSGHFAVVEPGRVRLVPLPPAKS